MPYYLYKENCSEGGIREYRSEASYAPPPPMGAGLA